MIVWPAIRTPGGEYVLNEAGGAGYGQRAVLSETAVRRGLPIRLPGSCAPATTADDIVNRDRREDARWVSHADAALIGILSATPDAAWDIDWHLVKGVSAKRGAQRGVSFDTALRGGIERTEWHLSR